VVGAESAAIERSLRARGIIASARGDVIRLAPHFYSTLDDVEQALDALAAVLEGGPARP
jgi:kynureninase